MTSGSGTVAGLILAGGRGARMGAGVPKPLLRLGERSLLAHVLARLPPTIAPVMISANDADAFVGLSLTLVRDRIEGFAGPLAGLDAAAARLAADHAGIAHLLMLPGDTPFLPTDLAAQMLAARGDRAVVARQGGHLQPVVTLWPIAALGALPGFLARSEKRSIRGFLDLIGFEVVDFADDPAAPGGDPFFNVNTPDELETARRFDTRR